MTISEYLKNRNLTIAKISKETELPYTTVREILTGTTDIDQCRVGVVMKIAKMLQMSVEEFCELYKESYPLPKVDGYEVVVRNKCYYLKPTDKKDRRMFRLCKISKDNTRFLEDFVRMELMDIAEEEEMRAVREWKSDDTM